MTRSSRTSICSILLVFPVTMRAEGHQTLYMSLDATIMPILLSLLVVGGVEYHQISQVMYPCH